MNALGTLFSLVTAGLLLSLPRHWALVPLLMGTVYVTVGQVVEVGPFHFTVLRLLLAVGILRVICKRERLPGNLNGLDKMMIAWAVWAVCSSVFHKEPSTALVSMLGVTYTGLGCYFLMRIFIQDLEGCLAAARVVILLLIPVAAEMVMEKLTGRNAFAVFGYVTEMDIVRHGKIRAQGPFAHGILAGTAGAACMPLALLFWRRDRRLACLGLVETGVMIMASASSGPIMTALTAFGAMAIWKLRSHMKGILWGLVFLILALSLVMHDPVWHLMSRIDLTGSSTGWHRAALIDAAIEHFGEWWFAGTDQTRHWMATGVPWSVNHTDITNHFIQMGVWGGFALMLLFIGIIWAAFARVGQALRLTAGAALEQQFMIWTFGSLLFAHATTFLSISYFDQTVVLFYLLLAAIGSLPDTMTAPITASGPDTVWPLTQYESDLCHNC